MNLKKKLFQRLKLYAIVDNDLLRKNVFKRKGITCIQVRQKNRSSMSVVKTIKDMKKILEPYRMPFFVNDRADAAVAANAYGLHAGSGDMPIKFLRKILGKNYIIGKTVRNERQAKIAEKEGADYVSVGPIFKTPLKKGLRPKGLSIIKKVKNAVKIPVVAIGGINFSNKDKVLRSGADGTAMLRGVK